MLDYEWVVNPSTIILAGNETAGGNDSDQTDRNIFNHNHTVVPDSITPTSFSHHHQHFNFNFNPPQHHQHQTFFDPRGFQSASTTFSPPPPSMLSLNPIPSLSTTHGGLRPEPGPGLFLMPKSNNAMNLESSGHGLELGFGFGFGFGPPRLGLNLGGRTYFPSTDDVANRLYRSVKTVESITTVSSNSPRCQAEGCNAHLSDAKHYHRRHKVCEYHSKAATVVAAGLTQRFCQQCSRLCSGPIIAFRVIPRAFRFHVLSEFDNGKRSCRKRLADHNRRRRKTQQPAQEIHKSQPSMDNVSRSSPESGTKSSSSLKKDVSPPDYFQETPNGNRGSSSTTTSGSLFFSSG